MYGWTREDFIQRARKKGGGVRESLVDSLSHEYSDSGDVCSSGTADNQSDRHINSRRSPSEPQSGGGRLWLTPNRRDSNRPTRGNIQRSTTGLM